MFLAGAFDALTRSGDGYRQLDGVLELLEFANSYVLSDRTAIGGAPVLGIGDISTFLGRQARETDAIEVIGHGPTYSWDLVPFQDRSRMDSLENRLDELDCVDEEEDSAERQRSFEDLNILEAQAYILLADAKGAAYVPDRVFGVQALEHYSEGLDRSQHLREHDAFRQQLTEQLRSRSNDISVITRVPSFLLEALHSARTWEGIFSALSDMRQSTAALHYRDLVRRSRSDDLNERRESRLELNRASRFAFEKEGLSGGLNRWIVPTIGLSAAAIAFLFPTAAPAAGMAAAVPPVIESLRAWLRVRNNLFEFYNRPLGADLYDELMRVFPKIRFRRENLEHFLSKKDFGWSEDLHFWLPARSQLTAES
jgi:hypothetical protein